MKSTNSSNKEEIREALSIAIGTRTDCGEKDQTANRGPNRRCNVIATVVADADAEDAGEEGSR